MATMELVFLCKKCKRAFRKEVSEFEEADEFCPHCDNHFIIEAKTPDTEGRFVVKIEQAAGHEHKLFKDDREKERSLTLQQEADWKPTHDPISDSELDDCM